MSDTRSLGERFRFAPSELNALIAQAVEEEKKLGNEVQKKSLRLIESGSLNEEFISYYEVTKSYQKAGEKFLKTMLLVEVTKDSQSKRNNPNLVYAGNVIKRLCLDYEDQDVTILMPTMQCRGHFKLPVNTPWISKWVQKRHIVLNETHLPTKRIFKHDPQSDFNVLLNWLASWLSLEIYPDKFLQLIAELKRADLDFSYQKKFYGKQHDNIVCGVFNHQYILSYLANGCADYFDDISVKLGNSPKGEKENADQIYLGDNSRQAYISTYLPNWAPADDLEDGSDDIWSGNSFDDLDLEEFEILNCVPDLQEILKKQTAAEKVPISRESRLSAFFNTLTKLLRQKKDDLNEESFVKIGDNGFFSSPPPIKKNYTDQSYQVTNRP